MRCVILVAAILLASSGVGTFSEAAAAPGLQSQSTEFQVERLWGPDRYTTAARIADQWESGAEVVYVASGTTFSYALAAAALAGATESPVLLTNPRALSSSTAIALRELGPRRVVVVGGVASVSEKALRQIRDVAGVKAVDRIPGVNGYEVAANATGEYREGQPRVVLATGEVFPDALAGAALAGHQGVPLLLASKNGLTPKTIAALRRLNPREILVLGGERTLPRSVAEEASSYSTSGAYRRVAGKDRYETAVQVAEEFDVISKTVLVASGTKFSDALVGGTLAAREGAPVLLTRQGSVPSVTASALSKGDLKALFVLGGEATISESTMAALANSGQPGYLREWGRPKFQDEFHFRDPTTGQPKVDPSKWNLRPRADLGLTFDAAQTRNEQVRVDSDGVLHIVGDWMDSPTPSGRSTGIKQLTHWTGYLDQRPLRDGDVSYEQRYGRWEVRARVPTGPGTLGALPAFWLRNQQSGEIDILEAWGYDKKAAPGGQRIDTATTTVHTHTSEASANTKYIWHHEDFGGPEEVWRDFHVYAFELTPHYAAIYVDGKQLTRVTPETHPNLWDPRYFSTPFHVRMNMHIGPSEKYWGLPDPNARKKTRDGLDFAIDYVRIYPYKE